MNSTPSVRDLMSAVSRDDRQALATLIHSESSRFFRFFANQIGETNGEDLLQDFWVKVWLARHRYCAEKGCIRWLYTIATRMVIDYLRRKKKEEPLGDIELTQTAICNLDYEQLKVACMDALPHQQRLVFYLCAVEGLTPSEAADTIGMNPSTLRNHWMIARRKLQGLVRSLFPELAPHRDD